MLRYLPQLHAYHAGTAPSIFPHLLSVEFLEDPRDMTTYADLCFPPLEVSHDIFEPTPFDMDITDT